MAYAKGGRIVANDNIAVGSVTGRENIVVAGAADEPGIAPVIHSESTVANVTATLARTDQTVTATATSHGLTVGQVVVMSGAAQEEYNGEFEVLTAADADTFTYEIPAGTPTSPATGTIVVRPHRGGSERHLAAAYPPSPEDRGN